MHADEHISADQTGVTTGQDRNGAGRCEAHRGLRCSPEQRHQGPDALNFWTRRSRTKVETLAIFGTSAKTLLSEKVALCTLAIRVLSTIDDIINICSEAHFRGNAKPVLDKY